MVDFALLPQILGRWQELLHDSFHCVDVDAVIELLRSGGKTLHTVIKHICPFYTQMWWEHQNIPDSHALAFKSW